MFLFHWAWRISHQEGHLRSAVVQTLRKETSVKSCCTEFCDIVSLLLQVLHVVNFYFSVDKREFYRENCREYPTFETPGVTDCPHLSPSISKGLVTFCCGRSLSECFISSSREHQFLKRTLCLFRTQQMSF